PHAPPCRDGTPALDLGIKALATGANERRRVYSIGGFTGHQRHNGHIDKIRSRRDRCDRKSRRRIRLSQVYQHVLQCKRKKQQNCLRKASHLIASRLVASTVASGALSQRQMVIKAHQERQRELHRTVFNDWGVYSVVRMLKYKCLHAGKRLESIQEW